MFLGLLMILPHLRHPTSRSLLVVFLLMMVHPQRKHKVLQALVLTRLNLLDPLQVLLYVSNVNE